MLKILLFSSLLAVEFSGFKSLQAQGQVIWKPIDTPEARPYLLDWKKTSNSEKSETSNPTWEVLPENQNGDQGSPKVIWELIEPEDETALPPLEASSGSKISPPTSLKEAEGLLNTIPLQSNDFKPLLNLSHAVPTASVLSREEWRLISSTISPFEYASGMGNQNHAVQLDYGFHDRLQLSGFYSGANDPLNASIVGFEVRSENFWEVFGASARWKFITNKNWSLAFNGSLESWTVGSGSSDSLTQTGNKASPNIFNDSGARVLTKNLIGSIALPLTWNANQKWQFTLNPGISFLPSSQGKGQGGAGEFYGTTTYISGGILWHPIPEIGLTFSLAQPLGTGKNSFNKNLKYSKVPIYSGGLNWHLNPRITLQGQLTNGFGATPATALLTLPSDNRLGYNAKIVLTPDAADTPQPPFSAKQQSLSLGGLTVNTALVPPDTNSFIKLGSDMYGSLETTVGYSISNIFQFEIYRSKTRNNAQSTAKARTYLGDNTDIWRGSGKAVLTSPLRGAPIWSALRISLGGNIDAINKPAQGYLFVETPLTWEATSQVAINISPKFAWSGSGNHSGIGISFNIDIAPNWQLIPEVNIIVNDQKSSNETLGLRWNANDNTSLEAYASTAPSLADVGQLLSAEEICWGGRFIIKL